jgi:glycosyltransferase involved in cell wall biosynthesis
VNLAISHAAAASAGAPRTRVIYPHLATAEQRGEAVPPVPEAGDPTVLVVSRLSARKGIERLPDVISATAQRLPGVRFLIAGDGELRRSLEEEIVRRALSPHVAVLGARDDVPGLHSLADIYLSPSAAEGLVGYATIEAATYGTPIVATSIPAVTEVLEDGSDALLVDPADGLGMADAIVRLARDPELAARLASGAARAIDEAIDVRRSTEELVALYDTFGPAG